MEELQLTEVSDIIPASMSLAIPSQDTACTSGESWFRVCRTRSTTLSTWYRPSALAQSFNQDELAENTTHWHGLLNQRLDILHHQKVKNNLDDLDFELIVCGRDLLNEEPK